MNEKSLKCFISYSHKDKRMKEKFKTHLDNLARTYNITDWHDGMIPAGGNIDKEVLENLKNSDIVFLLVSPDYINSYYCYEKELEIAIKRHNNKECIVVPVIIRKFVSGDYLFSNLKFVPTDGRPVESFRPHDRGFIDAFSGIRNLVKLFLESENNSKKEVKNNNKLTKSSQSSNKSKRKSNNKAKNSINYSIVKDGKCVSKKLTQSVFDSIKLYIQYLPQFSTDIDALANEQLTYLTRHKSDKVSDAAILRQRRNNIENYLLQLFTYIQQRFIGVDNTFVHFRVNYSGKYKTFLEVGYPIIGLSTEPISEVASMIGCSKSLQMPIIKSLNLELHRMAHPNEKIKRDYITFTFNEISMLYNVDLSMCISVLKKEKNIYKNMFYPMAIFRFDKVIEKMLIQYLEACKQSNLNYNIKKVLEYGGQ